MTLEAAASPVLLVSATRHSQPDFERSAWLAASLRRAASVWPLRLRLFANNTQGLPLCYNQAIDEAADDDVLVFVHDDVYLDDWMLGQHLMAALAQFDVVGVAGNTRCQPRQLAWHCLPPVPSADGIHVVREWDTPHLSGFVAHGAPLKSKVQGYGPVPQPVALLDGVLLAACALQGCASIRALIFIFMTWIFAEAPAPPVSRWVLGRWPSPTPAWAAVSVRPHGRRGPRNIYKSGGID